MVGIDLGVRWLFEPTLQGKLPFSFFYISIILTARLVGIWEAVLSVILGFLAAELFLIEPRWSLAVAGADGWPGSILYFLVGLAIVWFNKSEQAAHAGELTTAVEARKRQEELEHQLKDNLAGYREIFESSPAAQAGLDVSTGRLSLVNSSFCEITGYSAAELTQKSLLEIMQAEGLNSDWIAIQRSLRQTGRFLIEGRLIRKDGTTRRVTVDLAGLRDHDDEIHQAVAVLQEMIKIGRSRSPAWQFDKTKLRQPMLQESGLRPIYSNTFI